MDQKIRSSFEQLKTLAEKRDEVQYGFIKQVLVIASGLFGILVSLHKVTSTNKSDKILFASSIIFLALGIVSLTISMFSQVSASRKLFHEWRKEVMKQVEDINYRPQMVSFNPSKVYEFLEKIGYIFLLLFVICLSVYSVFIS